MQHVARPRSPIPRSAQNRASRRLLPPLSLFSCRDARLPGLPRRVAGAGAPASLRGGLPTLAREALATRPRRGARLPGSARARSRVASPVAELARAGVHGCRGRFAARAPVHAVAWPNPAPVRAPASFPCTADRQARFRSPCVDWFLRVD
jgi:hypothetical protein